MRGLRTMTGRRLDPAKTYKLNVPKDMPVKQFWALILQGFATWDSMQSGL
jgi:hypothetical protein